VVAVVLLVAIAGVVVLIVDAKRREAEAAERRATEQRDRADSERARAEAEKDAKQKASWKKTVELYSRLVKDPGSMSAEYAAESHFLLIELDMRKFEKFQIKGSQKVIDKQLKEGAQKVKDFEDRYREIQQYRRPEWSLAAEFRIGYAYEVYAKAILNIPPPPLDKKLQKQLKKLPPEDREMVMIEYEDRFRAAMEEKVLPMEERAQRAKWMKTDEDPDFEIPMAIDFVALLIAAYRIFDPAGAAGDRSRSAAQR